MDVFMITCIDQSGNAPPVNSFLSNTEAAGFYDWCDWSAEKGLERLVFQVSRKPGGLVGHLERIYYCFQHDLNEQLFGALIDLLIVLKKVGQELSKRMIVGSRSRLTENQFQTLFNQLNNSLTSSDLLPNSRYSCFTKGLQSMAVSVRLSEGDGYLEHDPLALARDYIEFSQLENAIHILEQAIFVQPERMELHDELLSLYRSTRNKTGFKRIYEELCSKSIGLPPKWQQLNDFFNS